MPRNLPWLAGSTCTPKSKPAKKRIKLSPSSSPPCRDQNETRRSSPHARGAGRPVARTPSTSPPPAPPSQIYMRESLNKDDAWIMVEDEFLTTAQKFTNHLHHAEYVRMKNRVAEKARRGEVAETTARPIDSRSELSREAEVEMDREKLQKGQRRGLKQGRDRKEDSGSWNEEEEDDPWKYDPYLAGLMAQPNLTPKKLCGWASTCEVPRATESRRALDTKGAAMRNTIQRSGVGERKVEGPVLRDDRGPGVDDLDGSSSGEDRNRPRQPLGGRTAPAAVDKRRTQEIRRPTPRREPPLRNEHESAPIKEKPLGADSYLAPDGRYEFSSPKTARYAKKRAKREEKDKPARVTEIPTFLV